MGEIKMKKYNAVNSALKQGQKITIVSSGEFGGIYVIQAKFTKCEPQLHYRNCPESMIGVKIQCLPKGKRSERIYTVSYNSPLVIYDGWVDIDADSIMYNKTTDGDATILESKYTMFDNRCFEELVAKYGTGLVTEI